MILILSSLQQRKKEIGLRLTIGANQNDIIQLFIIENISLSFIGGLGGIIMGVIGSYFLSTINHWQWVWNSQAITITILTNTSIAFIVSYFPARKASQLNPIHVIREP